MTTTQKVLFKRKTTDEIEQLEIEDGSLIYNVDNGKTYMDYGNERIQTGGNADTMIYVGDEEPTDEDIKLWIDTPTSETKASEIVTEYTESDKVGYCCNYVNGLNGKILWTNPNPTSAFASQTVTLSSDDYDIYEIVYVSETTGTLNRLLKTVKSLKGYDTILEITNPLGSTSPIRARNVTYVTDTSLTFSDGYAKNTYPLLTDNNKCIPLYIIGYKTGLFS